MTEPIEPAAPSRTRLIRPSFYRSAATGGLSAETRDFLLGLTTLADDAGWMLWRPAEIAANLYSYEPPARRSRDVERRAQELVDRNLVRIEPCGCAYLTTLLRDHAAKGGNRSFAISTWHREHVSGSVRTDTQKPVSGLGSDSSSGSDSVVGSVLHTEAEVAPAPARAHEAKPPLPPRVWEHLNKTTTTTDDLDASLVARANEFLGAARVNEDLWLEFAIEEPHRTGNEYLRSVLDRVAAPAGVNGRHP